MHGRVEIRLFDALGELARHGHRDRVRPLGPVEGDPRDAAGDVVAERVQAGSARARIASVSTPGRSVP